MKRLDLQTYLRFDFSKPSTNIFPHNSSLASCSMLLMNSQFRLFTKALLKKTSSLPYPVHVVSLTLKLNCGCCLMSSIVCLFLRHSDMERFCFLLGESHTAYSRNCCLDPSVVCLLFVSHSNMKCICLELDQ